LYPTKTYKYLVVYIQPKQTKTNQREVLDMINENEKNGNIKIKAGGSIRLKDIVKTNEEDIWYLITGQNKLKLMYKDQGCKI
jgi:hypothetical protein